MNNIHKLTFNRGEAKAQTYRDWIEMITLQLEAISAETADYWKAVTTEVQEHHAKYLALPTQQRPTLTVDSTAAKRYKEVERVVRPLMIAATPKYVQDQLLARGDVTVTKCVVECCIEAAPGGLEDKGTVLATLQFPRAAASPAEALRILRVWRQAWLRTDELHISRPDASLMLVGIRTVVGKADAGNADLRFRTATYLHEVQLPFQVDEDKLLKLRLCKTLF